MSLDATIRRSAARQSMPFRVVGTNGVTRMACLISPRDPHQANEEYRAMIRAGCTVVKLMRSADVIREFFADPQAGVGGT